MRKLFLDFESRSTIDIKKVGAWKYAQHPSTEIICAAWAYEGEAVRLWTPPWNPPGEMIPNTENFQVIAHNATFEYAVYNLILHRRYGWPALWDPRRWGCTMARGMACGLPASLEKLALALQLTFRKDMDGRRALLKICKPLYFDPVMDAPVYEESPELVQKVYEYCKLDVQTEMAADAVLPELSEDERKIWELDLVVNRRGIQIDYDLAASAVEKAGILTVQLNEKLKDLTGGAIDKATQVVAMKRWLLANGVSVKFGLDKNAVDSLLKDMSATVPAAVKEVLSIRRQVGKSSTAKYAATIHAASDTDFRVRGVLQYHAAATGRWGGRLIQPQNYPKGLDEKAQLEAIGAIKEARAAAFTLKYGSQAMQVLSDALRGTIIAAPGKRLLVADFSAIEARVVLWLAGDVGTLDKIRRGENLYLDMGEFLYRRKITKKDALEYALSKMAVLGCGYGLGKDRFLAQCQAQGLDVTIEQATAAVKAYREKYRSVVNMWYATERAAIAAVRTPGSAQQACAGKVQYAMSNDGKFLVCRLPSGRRLRYYRPTAKLVDGPMGEKPEIHYWAAGIGGDLEEFKTYGGSLVENITQAVARDLMANGMLKCEAAGYPIVLTVHDELVAEREKGIGRLDEFIRNMCDTPVWAAGCPVSAEGFESERYRK